MYKRGPYGHLPLISSRVSLDGFKRVAKNRLLQLMPASENSLILLKTSPATTLSRTDVLMLMLNIL